MNASTPVLLSAVAGTILIATSLAPAADHREAPLIRQDLAADIADLYVFRAPDDPTRVVLAMTVNGFSAPSENTTYTFSPQVQYSFHVDNTNDGVEDTRIDFTFSDNADGSQSYNYTVGSNISAIQLPVTAPTLEPKPNAPVINANAGITTFAGQRDDPFFFDVVGFNRFLAGTGAFDGTDGFAGFNTSAIVIELPLNLINGGNTNLQVWATTQRRLATVRRSAEGLLEYSLGPYQQIERMGNPAINTALLPLAKKDLFNIGLPVNDADDFAGDIVASLESLGTNSKNIGILASVALPDTIKFDASVDSAYPNGRAPADDVIDTLLFFIFNQTSVPDGVAMNDQAFLSSFPYLAPPHQP